MRKTRFEKSLSLIVCIVLIAAIALFTTGCNDNKNTAGNTDSGATTAQNDSNVLGQGETSFTFTVVDGEGNETTYQINTDKKTVGEALLELDLIAGEDGAYGLYVKTVNGITVDYDKDGKYWAFYVDGEYAMAGVDATEISAGSEYAFKVE